MIEQNEYGTLDIQNALLNTIKLFHQFCMKNGIRYSLYGGSCLGAIRHKGFIPWDDDLDICVDRENYNLLISRFNRADGLKMQKTIWINRIQMEDAKEIRGYVPTLDVFVIDNAPDKEFEYKIKILRLSILQGMMKEDVVYKGFSFMNRCLLFGTHILGKLFSKKTLERWYDETSIIGNEKTSSFVHCTNTSYAWIKKLYPASTWTDTRLVPFEDTELFIPVNYNDYLEICYGDYMKLPPKEMRKPEHIM